jgi:hypothetical protein
MGRVILGGKEVIMSMHREEVLELVRQLPDEVDVEEVIYRLSLREKLAAAEALVERLLTATERLEFPESEGKVLVWRGDAAPTPPVRQPEPAPLVYTPTHLRVLANHTSARGTCTGRCHCSNAL